MTDKDYLNKVAILNVSNELLCDVLHLPSGTKIIGAHNPDVFGFISLRVTSPEFRELQEGESLSAVDVIITKHCGEHPDTYESKWKELP